MSENSYLGANGFGQIARDNWKVLEMMANKFSNCFKVSEFIELNIGLNDELSILMEEAINNEHTRS